MGGGVKNNGITQQRQTPLTQIPAKSAETLPRPLFGYETLLTQVVWEKWVP